MHAPMYIYICICMYVNFITDIFFTHTHTHTHTSQTGMLAEAINKGPVLQRVDENSTACVCA